MRCIQAADKEALCLLQWLATSQADEDELARETGEGQ